MQATENESERETIPTSVSSRGGTAGQGFWSALLSSCVAQGQRGEERRGGGQTYGAGRWNISHNHSVKWWRVFQVEETSAPSAFSEVWWSVTLADWRKLSGRESWFDVCLVVVSVLPPFHTAICALTACVRVPSGRVCVLMYTCICASVCIMHVCVLLLYLPLVPLPVLYHTLLPFSLFGRGVCSRSSQEVFVTRRAEGEGEQ